MFRFIVADRINEYRGTGGVRIEDDVIVHANHTELMSVVPRNVHTIINVVINFGFSFLKFRDNVLTSVYMRYNSGREGTLGCVLQLVLFCIR